jgi:ABC-type multidrug transport system fused ATPase/permease subunit
MERLPTLARLRSIPRPTRKWSSSTRAAAAAPSNGKAPLASLSTLCSARWDRTIYTFFTRTDWVLFAVGNVSSAFCGVCLLYRFMQVGKFADIVAAAEFGIDNDAVRALALSMFGAGVACWLSGWCATLCLNTVKDRQTLAWSGFYAKLALSREPGWLEKPGHTAKLNKFAEDINAIASAHSIDAWGQLSEIGGQLLSGLLIGLLMVPPYVVLLIIAPMLIIIFGVVPPLVKRNASLEAKCFPLIVSAFATGTETLHAQRTVAALGLEEMRLQIFHQRGQEWWSTKDRAGFSTGVVVGISSVPASLAFLLGYIYSVHYLTDAMDDSRFVWSLPAQGGSGGALGAAGWAASNASGGALATAAWVAANGTRVLCSTSSDIAAATWRAGTCDGGATPVEMTCQLASIVLNSDEGLSFFGVPDEAGFQRVLRANGSYGPCSPTGAALFIAMVVLSTGMGALNQRPTASRAVAAGREAGSKMLSVAEADATIPSGFDATGESPASASGALAFESVVFAYPSRSGAPVYRDFSLHIPAGQLAALVGPSGSGKSTAVLLLERFYDPQSGGVTLDGADLRTLNVRWLREQMGLVSQEPVLFQGTVGENIAHGKAGATRAEIEDAAKAANAHGFVSEFSDGYETLVGEKGAQISGGQKQRIAIARAIIKRPAVLLLDEATSALDNESEKVVQAALDELVAASKRTTIVIAHRLSTVRGADTIAVVSKGAVAEQGTHTQLLAAGGLYAELAKPK